MNRFIDLLAARTARERLLLALLVFVGLPALTFVAVIEPVASARAAAAAARDDAVALNAWVVARAQEVPARTSTPAQDVAPIGSTGIETSLRAAGLRPAVTDLTENNAGVISLRFDSVTFTTLAAWVSGQSGGWGYRLSQFRISATDAPGKVAAALTLEPRS
ncbi:type II secretion system protein GspM [Tateyamaria sp. SN6-1]|uniref:type II secretion system protein GspM n=1 Tax=Tateyamaria sp. SN6-1 TaxID=3092148 RepID=UPI0039F57023